MEGSACHRLWLARKNGKAADLVASLVFILACQLRDHVGELAAPNPTSEARPHADNPAVRRAKKLRTIPAALVGCAERKRLVRARSLKLLLQRRREGHLALSSHLLIARKMTAALGAWSRAITQLLTSQVIAASESWLA